MPYRPLGFLKYLLWAWPFAELAFFFWIASILGFFLTLLLAILTSVWGLAIVRWEGAHRMMELMRRLQRGDHAPQAVMEIAMTMMAGFLLLLPGLLTDALGAFMLCAPVQRWFLKQLLARGMVMPANTARKQGTNVIEGEFWRH